MPATAAAAMVQHVAAKVTSEAHLAKKLTGAGTGTRAWSGRGSPLRSCRAATAGRLPSTKRHTSKAEARPSASTAAAAS